MKLDKLDFFQNLKMSSGFLMKQMKRGPHTTSGDERSAVVIPRAKEKEKAQKDADVSNPGKARAKENTPTGAKKKKMNTVPGQKAKEKAKAKARAKEKERKKEKQKRKEKEKVMAKAKARHTLLNGTLDGMPGLQRHTPTTRAMPGAGMESRGAGTKVIGKQRHHRQPFRNQQKRTDSLSNMCT